MLACFYADNGLIVLRDPDFLQRAFDALTDLFDRVGLKTNTTKTETMAFLPGAIRTRLSEDGYRAQMDNHFRNSCKGCRVNCNLCNQELAVGLLRSHLETQHDVYRSFALAKARVAVDKAPEEYDARYDIGAQYYA